MRSFFIFLLFVFQLTHAVAQDSLKTLDLKEVVVTGQFEPQSLRQSVYQVRTINQETIRQRAATNVQSILNTELGIRFSNDLTLGTADISLMGMSGQNVKILLDGVPLLDRGATKESLNQIDVRTIERIEIVEGPMSVVYGADALAGVINIITKKGNEDNQKFSVDASVQEETAGKKYRTFSGKGLHNESVSATWQTGKWNASAGITRNDFGGWNENRVAATPTTPNSEWHPKAQWLGTGSIGYTKKGVNIWYRLNYLNEDILSEEPIFQDQGTRKLMAPDRRFITNRFTHQMQAEWLLNDRWSFNGIASYQDYSRKTQTTVVNIETGERRLYADEAGAQDESLFNSKILRAIAVHKWSASVSMQTGIDINLNKGFGDRIDGTRSIGDYALFSSVEITPARGINIRPGLRFMHNSVYDAPPVIPSLNTKFSLTDKLDLRLSYARGFRAPALRELYFSFHDANHDIDGNPDLKAEHSNSLTGSLAWQAYQNTAMRLSVTAGSFYNQFDNMISLVADSEDSRLSTYVNILKSRTTGATLNNALYWKSLHVSLGFSYIGVYNSYSEEDASLPTLMWTPEVNSTVTYYFEKAGASLGVFYKFSGVRGRYVDTVVDFEPKIVLGEVQEYHLADITASKKISKLFNLAAGVKNLFNVGQVNSTLTGDGVHSPGGPVSVGYGRSYFVSLNFHITQ
jgi:outer membrane receptor for ferrienterochelin and colicins